MQGWAEVILAVRSKLGTHDKPTSVQVPTEGLTIMYVIVA